MKAAFPFAPSIKLTSYQTLVLGFAALILFGALLLMLPAASASGHSLNFLDALFTATSAVCVTGLVVVDTGTQFSLWGQLIIIVLIQIGAIGIMTASTLFAILLGKKIQLKERLLMQEALNQLSLEGVVRLTLNVVKMTLLIECIGGTLLAIRWYGDFGLQGIYFGYWHAISNFCNAGFDLFGNFRSLTGYTGDIIVNFTIMALITLGGIGFTVLADLWHYQTFAKLQLHTKLVLTASLLLLAAGFLVIAVLEYNNPATLGPLPWFDKLLAALFQSVTPRTAGCNTIDIGSLQPATLFFIIILMFIGASPASTGGGVKTSTFGVGLAALWSLLRGSNSAISFSRQIPAPTIYRAFSIIFLSSLLVISITMLLCVTEQAPFLNLLFETVSAFGTVGLSTGITPSLSPLGKLALIVTMFAGRLGPVTLITALALRQKKSVIKYPDGKIIIG